MRFLFIKRTLLAGALCWSGVRTSAQITGLPAHPPAPQLTAAEYFFDADPGFGNGLPLAVTNGADITGTFTIPVTTLGKGAHRLFVRSRNGAGRWSMTLSQELVIYALIGTLPQAVNGSRVVAAEYFVDTDPGPGNATTVALSGPGDDLTAANVPVNISGLSLGLHRVFFRTRNEAGQWSLSAGSGFTILINTIGSLPAHPAIRPVTAIEYFIDTDPGFGNGTVLNVPPTTDLSDQRVAVDVTGLTGTHTLFVRSINGHSMTAAHSFTIAGTALPLSWLNADLHAEAGAAALSWNISQPADGTAYRIERSADGRSFETIGSLPAAGGPIMATYHYRDEHPLYGMSWYRIRLERTDGSSSVSPVMSLRRGDAASEIRINNPVGNTLTIRRLGDGAENLELSIRNTSGQLIRVLGSGSAVQAVDISALPAGMYLLCWQQDGEARAAKFIKQ